MTTPVLVDTGPLVACLDRSDSEHERCTDALKSLKLPVVTTWPVLTEAAWQLRQSSEALQRLFTLIEDGHVRVHHLPEDAAIWLKDFFTRYADQSPQLADASLIYLADALDAGTIFTLDRRDFSVFRRTDGSPLEIVPAQPLSLGPEHGWLYPTDTGTAASSKEDAR